jgi:hypothetical protein
MSSIVFEGNTYTFGATVSANPGTGTTSYVFGGLSSGSTYGFILWTFNGFGPSSIVGPITKVTLSSIPEEFRDPIVTMGTIPYNVGYDGWSIYTNPDANNPNLLPSSTNLFTASSVPAGTLVYYVNNGNQPPASNKTGFTAPDGSTTAYEMVATAISSFMINATIAVEPGYTYYISYYHDLGRGAGTTGMGAPTMYYYSPTRIIQTRQILPVVGSPGYGQQALYPTGPTAPTGWTRFAYEFYASPGITGTRTISLTLLGPNQGKTGYFWGPQLERAT